MKNEKTSLRIARIAAKLLDKIKMTGSVSTNPVYIYRAYDGNDGYYDTIICTVGELKSLAASALTQTPDKPKRKRVTIKELKAAQKDLLKKGK